jgi:hypothetical protein
MKLSNLHYKEPKVEAQPGIAPGTYAYEAFMLLLHHRAKLNMVAGDGIEPPTLGYEPSEIPLLQPAMWSQPNAD